MASESFKTSNSKNSQLKFLRFFQTISDKNYGKYCYLGNFMSSDVMGSQHCIGGEREF